mgnify:CR=1 FL=1
MTDILKTEGLSRYFGAVVAADDINVTITDGEIVGVIGSNGAGKTTFINMVTRSRFHSFSWNFPFWTIS